MLAALRTIFYLAIAAIIAAGALYGWGHSQFTANGPLAKDKTVVLPKGASLRGIARTLRQERVISNDFIFHIAVRMEDTARRLKAGEYLFPAGISMREVMHVLIEGKTLVRKITVPEGLSSTEILQLLTKAKGLKGKVPTTVPEGTLLPETYHFSFGDNRGELLRRMQRNMKQALARVWADRDPKIPLKNPVELLTLASIIEKETGVGSERARVAGVFVNRLRRGMKLQSDPTVTYGITFGRKPLGRPLSRKDLRRRTAYNTYTIPALPPGPIANPGLLALRAAAQPMKTKDLYFVADGTGGHAFAKTLAEHNRNVRKWRRIERERKR